MRSLFEVHTYLSIYRISVFPIDEIPSIVAPRAPDRDMRTVNSTYDSRKVAVPIKLLLSLMELFICGGKFYELCSMLSNCHRYRQHNTTNAGL